MSKKVSFEGIGEMAATFFTEGEVKGGQVVKISGDSKVKACAAGERFCGVALADAREGFAAVQTHGFAQVRCADESVTVGYVELTADGTGGVKKVSTAAGSTDKGQEYLVVADDGAGTITIKM